MHLRLNAVAGVLVATLAAGLFAQSQAPGPGSPTGTAVPGIAAPAPRQRPTEIPAVPSVGTGIIRGRVVRADTGQPLPKSRVSLSIPNSRDVLVATTDANGRYELKALPAGRHTLRAQKNGFIALGTGQRRQGEPSRPIELGEGQTLERIDFALPPGGVIAGRVLDEAGEPLAGAVVQVLRAQYTQGRRGLVDAGAVSDVTDDLGQFRLFGLAERSYVLSASPPALRLPSSNQVPSQGSLGVATYYPGTIAEADARSIRVEPGSEVTGLTFAIVPVRLAAIVGTVRTSDGSIPPSGAWLEVLKEGGTGTGGNLLRPDGTFAVPNLPPGRYTVSAWLTLQSDQGARTEVVLDGADGAVALTFRKGDTARGRLTFDTGEPPPTLQPTSVRISAGATGPVYQPPTQLAQVVRDDWTFEVPRLIGRRGLSVTVPSGWAVRSIRLDGRDITDEQLDFNGKDIDGIVVRLTQQISTVGGLVRNDRGQTVADARVVLFAEEREKWGPGSRFMRAVRPEPDGRFTIRGLPAARYLAVALDFLEPGEETNPETLEQLRRFGKVVTLADESSATVDLTVTSAP